MAVAAMTAEGKIALVKSARVFGKAAWENGTAVILKRSLGLGISVCGDGAVAGQMLLRKKRAVILIAKELRRLIVVFEQGESAKLTDG
jgi:hypothetical protein